MRLSEINPNDIAHVAPAPSASPKKGMRLSDLDPSEIAEVAEPASRPIPDVIADTAKGLLGPVKRNVVDPVMNALDYAAAPVRAGVGKYQSLPDSAQFSPKGIAAAGMEGARFLKNEITGAATPKDAPTVEALYDKSDLKRLIDRPSVTNAVGQFLLKGGTNADPLRSEPGSEWDTRELLGDDYSQTGKDLGRVATNLGGQLVAGGLMDPLNYAAPGAKGLLSKAVPVVEEAGKAGAQALRQGYKARVAEAVAGSLDAAPPTPPAPPKSAMTSAKELSKYVDASKAAGLSTELPAAKALEKAEALTKDLKHPILPAQKKATTNLADRDTYRTLKDSGTKTANTISEYEQLQRNEAIQKIDDTINNLAPSKNAKSDSFTVGEKLKNDFVSKYQENKAKLGKAFNRYDATKIDPFEHVPLLTDKIAARAPGITDFIEVSDEAAKLKPYTPAMGISKVEYDTLNEVVNTLNSTPLTVKQIRNIRGSLLNSFPDPLTRPPMVNAIRQGMLDHIRDLVAKKNPGKSKEVFNTFKNYAINEQNLDELERVFGGSFSEYAQGRKEVIPERVLNRIFSSTRSAKIAKKALGEEAFGEAFASYLASKKASFMNKEGAFSSRRFGEWISKNRTVLDTVAPDKTQLDRLEALSTILRLTADAPPINPSGTAKTYGLLQDVWGAVKEPQGVGDIVATPLKAGAAAFNNIRKNRGAVNTFNRLSGEPGLLQKAFEKGVSPENRALLKRFLQDEEGAFTPDELMQILKPGEENVFDLKKARGMAGEPKRGLIAGEADVIPNKPTWDQLTPEDRRLAEALSKKVQKGETLTGREQEYLYSVIRKSRERDRGLMDSALTTRKAHFANQTGANERELGDIFDRLSAKVDGGQNLSEQEFDFLKTVYHSADKKGDQELLQKAHRIMVSDWQVKPKEAPQGLLTSLDVERGPVKELPEAGKVSPLVMQNGRPPELKAGTVIDLPNGKQVITVGDYSHFEPGEGRVYWVEPSSAAGFEPGSSGKQFQISEKEMLGEKYADYFASKQAELDAARRESSDFQNRYANDKKTESERIQKGLIGVDFGGRGGKMPKAKNTSPAIGEVWNGPSGKKYTVLATEKEGGKTYVKVEHIDVSGGPNDGKKITTWEEADDPKIFYGRESRGESGPRGKKELFDALMSGEKKVPGISVKRGKENPNQGLIDDLWANRKIPDNTPVDVPLGGKVTLKKAQTNSMGAGNPKFEVVEALDDDSGYLLFDPENNRTFEAKHEDILGVFNEKGKPVKPKGGKGKPKKKK